MKDIDQNEKYIADKLRELEAKEVIEDIIQKLGKSSIYTTYWRKIRFYYDNK